ncbi:TauD/TfdA family dioxygenase [Paenibacillus tritici]|uniref:TauD/TfdA family dioxygenase n=1 Tax=Paenibacillus tritici TaxID=1873425 RepID=UPI001BA9CFD4|nr:TauD/TfdA family dioxygenase [Paenibacillus tritici]QUL57072.1 TauD/TfdA family dioxygenase [Paenibacillus tritici]
MTHEELLFNKYFVDITQAALVENISRKLDRFGLVTFENIHSREQLINFAEKFGAIFMHRDSDADGITVVNDRGYEEITAGYEGLSNAELTLHTDRSGEKSPPELMFFVCKKQALVGGETFLVDGKEVLDIMSKEYQSEYHQILENKSVIFGGADELYCGSMINRLSNGNYSIRFRFDELGYFSSNTYNAVKRLLQVMKERAFKLRLKENQGYLIKNDRILHGRTNFQGEREMHRLLVCLNHLSRIAPGFDMQVKNAVN